MLQLEKHLTVEAPLTRVWAALTDRASIAAWMVDEAAEVDLRVGGRVVFFGGETTGTLTEIQPQRVLEYTWRQDTWTDDWADSRVRWELRALSPGETEIHLIHSGFPNEDERDSHDEGWHFYWLEPMCEWLLGR